MAPWHRGTGQHGTGQHGQLPDRLHSQGTKRLGLGMPDPVQLADRKWPESAVSDADT
ncbi:hypothetical protein [Streptomyces sp. NBC_00564]|uniref:hypothetical protein n=1 Tax=Streptomyces sp. NBC_00564 TaxID=2903663 RepID=UPI00352E8826|nr:hypothetical protein OG256_45095 [Streptomyces sp. NBC_00564]